MLTSPTLLVPVLRPAVLVVRALPSALHRPILDSQASAQPPCQTQSTSSVNKAMLRGSTWAIVLPVRSATYSRAPTRCHADTCQQRVDYAISFRVSSPQQRVSISNGECTQPLFRVPWEHCRSIILSIFNI